MAKESQQGNISTDVAVILEKVKNIEKKVDSLCGVLDNHEKAIGQLEVKEAQLETKVSNFAIMQGALSVVIGAIASFLGMNNK